MRLRKILVLILSLGTLLGLLACGQKGPLYMPVPSQTTVTSPAAPGAIAPTTAATTDTPKKP